MEKGSSCSSSSWVFPSWTRVRSLSSVTILGILLMRVRSISSSSSWVMEFGDLGGVGFGVCGLGCGFAVI